MLKEIEFLMWMILSLLESPLLLETGMVKQVLLNDELAAIWVLNNLNTLLIGEWKLLVVM